MQIWFQVDLHYQDALLFPKNGTKGDFFLKKICLQLVYNDPYICKENIYYHFLRTSLWNLIWYTFVWWER